MATEPVRILEKYYRSQKNLPKQVVEVFPEAMSNAHLISAQLHLKAGRWTNTLAAVMKAAQYSKHHCNEYKISAYSTQRPLQPGFT